MKPRVNIGKNIRFARMDRRMTQRELAERTGLSICEISQIENGAVKPKFTTLELLAEAFNCSMSYLVRELWS